MNLLGHVFKLYVHQIHDKLNNINFCTPKIDKNKPKNNKEICTHKKQSYCQKRISSRQPLDNVHGENKAEKRYA